MADRDNVTLSPKDEKIRSLEAMVAADGEIIAGLRAAVADLLGEVDRRLEYGETGGHLEYVRDRLREMAYA